MSSEKETVVLPYNSEPLRTWKIKTLEHRSNQTTLKWHYFLLGLSLKGNLRRVGRFNY